MPSLQCCCLNVWACYDPLYTQNTFLWKTFNIFSFPNVPKSHGDVLGSIFIYRAGALNGLYVLFQS